MLAYSRMDKTTRELELMVEFGMSPVDVLKSATSVNAKVFHMDKEIGRSG